ncbi:MAG: GMP synthase [Bacteroidota bacterium]
MPTANFMKSTASIAAWNLATFNPLSQDRIALQARGLQLMDAELITLVEIKDENHIRGLVDHISKDSVKYDYAFLEQSSPDDSTNHSAMHIGVIFRQGVSVTNSELLDGSDLGNSGYRKAFLCDVVIGNFSFKLIGVHLKSGRGLKEQRIRDRQCKVIGDYIKAIRGTSNRNPDVLLMGDFNMIPGQDISNFHFLGGDDILDFVSSWDLQERYSHILPSGRENLLDGFAISKRYSTEYIRGSLRLFPMHWTMGMGQAKYRDEVSDHLPFVASFDITKSRD